MRTELGSEMEVGLVQVGNLGPLVLARRGKSAARQSRRGQAKSANRRPTGEADTQRWVYPVYSVLTYISLSSLRDGDSTGAQRIIFCTSADAAALIIPQISSRDLEEVGSQQWSHGADLSRHLACAGARKYNVLTG
jgi:hypothetical protein